MKVKPEGIGGWLLVYTIALAIQLVHGIGLTIGATIIYSDPSLASLHTFIPLWALLFYVITNLIAACYAIVLFILMFKHRHSAIGNNIAFNILTISFLVSWHVLGAKSNVGTVIDVLPGVIGLCYFLVSKRVRNTFTVGIR
jgi:hypothetical protein